MELRRQTYVIAKAKNQEYGHVAMMLLANEYKGIGVRV